MYLVECFKEELPCPRVKTEPDWMTGRELASLRKEMKFDFIIYIRKTFLIRWSQDLSLQNIIC